MKKETDTADKLLDAGLSLFAEKGFSATTTRTIAEKAGVNEVTLFRHYGSKEKLFFAVIDREASVRLDIIDMRFEPSDDLVNDLAEMGNYMAENMVKRASFFKLLVMEVDRSPEIWEHIGKVPLEAINKLSQYFEQAKKEGLVRKDTDTEIMAISFFSFLFRILVVNAFLGDDLFMQDKTDGIRRFSEIFVNGIKEED